MFESFVGSIFFEFVGVLTKWIFYYFGSLFKGEEPRSFLSVWEGIKNKKKVDGDVTFIMDGISNILLGIIVTIILCWLIILLTGG